jgi:transposase
VALEATGNSDAAPNLLTPIVGRVVVSNPAKTRAIAEVKVKTDKVDARILAQLLAADFVPPVSDLFGKTARHWLFVQPLPADERCSVHALLRQLDFPRWRAGGGRQGVGYRGAR